MEAVLLNYAEMRGVFAFRSLDSLLQRSKLSSMDFANQLHQIFAGFASHIWMILGLAALAGIVTIFQLSKREISR